MADEGTRVAFDREQYEKVRNLVADVARTTDDALWNTDGYAIGPELRAQPTEATWEPAMKIGNDVSALAGQVRTFTERFTEKTLPDFENQLAKAEQLFEETDDLSTSQASGSGQG